MRLKLSLLILALLGALSIPPALWATTVMEMNLATLAERSDKVFRGTVLSVSETSVQAGGGTIPAIIYTLRVDDALKGSFDEVKGETLVEIKMVGTLKQYHAGKGPIAGFPLLKTGADYLLMVAHPGPVGLTSPMGLGQGTFNIFTDPSTRQEMALNGFNNVALFKGLAKSTRDLAKSAPTEGPVPYSMLADMIRATID
ncbi:MAG: hypothetical protein QNJ40_09445 [Xanthomonadales bacterium]|nr:hypothetical protein [Xanthomonadales bacterium]